MFTSKEREQRRTIRYDYYHAGRLVWLSGNFFGASIMFGYAIESILKEGIIELIDEQTHKRDKELTRVLWRSHDVRDIMKKCREYNLFNNVTFSEDFLEHVDNNFQRYHSQRKRVLNETSSKNIALANSSENILYYDDFIIQLDRYLLESVSDCNISIIYLAFLNLDTRNALEILRENAFALLKFDEYANLVRQNMPDRDDLRRRVEENLSKGVAFYWGSNVTHDQIAVIAEKYSASKFQRPRWKLVDGYWEVSI